MSLPPQPEPMTTSFASPISVSSGASYLFSIRLTSFLSLFVQTRTYKIVHLCGSERLPRHRTIRAMPQPQFEQNDLPQLGLVAVQPNAKALQAREDARAIHNSSLHYVQLPSLQEGAGHWPQRLLPRGVKQALG